jgi:hypothetical protein
MNSASLGNRQSRQPKQSSNANQKLISTRTRTKGGPQNESNGLNQCDNGVCQLSWKPVQIDSKVSENLGS